MKALRISSIIVLLGALLASLFVSCNYSSNRVESVDSKTKLHEVKNFNQIMLVGGYNVTLIQSSDSEIIIDAEEKFHDKTDIYVKNETLYLKMKKNQISTDSKINVEISFIELEKITVEGGVVLNTDGFIKCDNFDIHIKGGAHSNIKIKANHINAKGEGGVNMRFEGVSDTFTVSTEGAGNIDARHLKSRVVNCRVAGVGNASVYATDELFANVEGLGRINYRGNPEVHKNVQGIGVVHRK